MGDHHSLPLLLFLLPPSPSLSPLSSFLTLLHYLPLPSLFLSPSSLNALHFYSNPPLVFLCFLSSILAPSSSPPPLSYLMLFPLLLPQMTLKDIGRVRLFKLGVATDEYAVVFTNEYIGHARQHLGRTALCKKFVDVVLPACQDVSITRKQLTDKLRVSEEDIS